MGVWNAETLEELSARDLSEGMSVNVQKRLAQYKTDLADPERCFDEVWTLYPSGKPTTLNVKFRGQILDDGRLAMLCEGTVDEQREPEGIRSAQALIHTPIQISMITETGAVLYLNPAAREMRSELDTDLIDRFCVRREGEIFLKDLKARKANKVVAQVQTIRGRRWHEINAVQCLDAVTGSKAYLLSEIDVTDLKLAETRAETADRAKTEFLANMSHELRTPLNAIIGFSDFMMSGTIPGPRPDKYMEYINDIHVSGQHLLRVINDILDLAKVEAGQMTMNPAQVDLHETFTALERLMVPQAAEKNLTLSFVTDPTLSVMADSGRFNQILMNLLSNAIKFTDEGGSINVEAQLNRDDVSVTVCDTGIGMSEAEIKEALQPFRQVDSSITRQFQGTGLGLPLSRLLVEKQNGSLAVQSVPGQGTIIVVKLPAYEVAMRENVRLQLVG